MFPRGSDLLPVLFILYTQPLFEIVKKHTVNHHSFADVKKHTVNHHTFADVKKHTVNHHAFADDNLP